MKKKNEQLKNLTPEQQAFLEKEKKIERINNHINKPILFITYLFSGCFLALIIFLMKFMIVDKDDVIANAANSRLDSYASNVIRGEILTSDDVTIAKNGKNAETRQYPYDRLFSHVVGYSKYGKAGAELIGNYYLLTCNANIFQRTYKMLREEKNIGDNMITTLDFDLQQTAYDALGGANGAVVVMEPDTGKILAMVSKPDFNPNDMDAVWEAAQKDESGDAVLLNRATQGLYPPGSTFKVLTTLEFLREHPNKFKKYSYDCNEQTTVFSHVSVRCYDNKIHGKQNVAEALAYSCNKAYSDIGTNLNMGKFKSTLETFLFNQSLPYKDNYSVSRFYLNSKSEKGLIPQTSFGQGDTLITPLHNAMIFSAIANGGVMMKPYLIDRVETHEGVKVKKFTPSSYATVMTTDEADTLTDLMKGVVEYGTAANYFSGASYDVAGKTGTAEYDNGNHDYSWFVGFSNINNPDIVVSVVIEEADVNGVRATAVSRKIFDAYYNR